MKLAICWIGIGKYANYFDSFYDSFNKNFCTEQERTFFIFTDDSSLTEKIDYDPAYENCLVYEISHACHNVGFILFRKFKYLLMAEDKFLDYDYVIFCNGNMVAVKPIAFSDIGPANKEISVIGHSIDTNSNMHSNGTRYIGTAAECTFTDWQYLQAGFFVSKTLFFLRLANSIESMRMKDKADGKSVEIQWHDENYYNSFLSRNSSSIRLLPYLIYNCPIGWKSGSAITHIKHHSHRSVNDICIFLDKIPEIQADKGSYADFKNDLY